MAKCWYHLQGVITGCIFLVLTIIMIPFTLVNDKMDVNISDPALMEKYDDTQDLLPPLVSLFRQLLQLGMALLSICCMILLGFADDVLGKIRQSDTLRLKSNNISWYPNQYPTWISFFEIYRSEMETQAIFTNNSFITNSCCVLHYHKSDRNCCSSISSAMDWQYCRTWSTLLRVYGNACNILHERN